MEEEDHSSAEQIDIHAPFTKPELIQQLAEIDTDIALLLTHAGTAVQFLATEGAPENTTTTANPGSPGQEETTTTNISNLNPQERLATFKESMNAFISTLHSVDVRLKRQIWALEEAGIITLNAAAGAAAGREGGVAGPGSADGATAGGGGGVGGAMVAGGDGSEPAAAGRANLEPDGIGKIGGLDVGWLNARSNELDKGMEAELWTGLRAQLEKIAERRLGIEDGFFGTGVAGAGEAEREGAAGGEDHA